MINLYFTPVSGSISSSLAIINDNPNILPIAYTNVQIEITSSEYRISGSDNFLNYTRLYVKSGSYVYASFPIEETNIIYLSNGPVDVLTVASVTTYNTYYEFNPGTNITSSLNKFEIFNKSTNTMFVSASQSFDNSQIQLEYNNFYDVKVSGSGNYYTSTLRFVNSSTNQTFFYTSSINKYITGSLFVSSSSPQNNFSIYAQTTTEPYLRLVYQSAASIPVSPSGSINAWNTYLGANASYVSASNNIVDIVGGNLSSSSLSSIYITSSGNLTSFDPIGMGNIITCNVYSQSLQSFPTMSNISGIKYFDFSNNAISGALPPLTTNSSLIYFNVSNNKLTGSISESLFLNNTNIIHFDCSYNKLSGSIPPLPGNCNLEYFDCSHNKMSGSLSTLGAVNLQYFDCSYNRLTGSLSLNAPNFGLQTFNCSNNKLSGILSASIFDYTVSLKNFDCSNNTLSGSLPEVSSSYALENFYCYSNYFTGSLPQFTTGSPNLVKYWCSNNRITGSLPDFSNSNLRDFICDNNILYGDIDLTGASKIVSMSISNNKFSGSLLTFEGCDSLQYFDYSYNHITGDIPRISNAPNLVTFKCTSNGGLQDYNYITDVFPVSLKYFYAYDSNIFKTSAIDGILYGLDSSGATNGIAVLDGASNASPSSPTGENYVTSLIGKGWSVSVNP